MRADDADIREIHILEGMEILEWVGLPCTALAAVGLTSCGVMRAKPPYLEQRVASEFAGVIVTLSGQGRARIDGAWSEMASGSVLTLPPGAAHGYAASASWELAWAAGPPLLRPLLRGGGCRLLRNDGSGLAEAVRALVREQRGRGDAALLALLAGRVRREAELLLCEPGDQALWALWREVGKDLRRSWSLDELAARTGIGAEQLRRRCQASHGCTPMAMVRKLRLETAAALLVQGGRGLAGIAELVGYATPFSLSAAFTRHFGRPPQRWRPDRS